MAYCSTCAQAHNRTLQSPTSPELVVNLSDRQRLYALADRLEKGELREQVCARVRMLVG